MSDSIRPDHYQGGIECIDAIEEALTPEEFAGFCKGNVVKYLWRCNKKNGIEDLQKAKWYLDRLVDSFDESEQKKASDLQSLKDHPSGKPEQPKWTPKVGDWVRIKKPSDTHLFGPVWVGEMDKYDGQIIEVKEIIGGGIVQDRWGFLFDWLQPAEQPAWAPKVGDGYRKLGDSSEEPRQLGDLRWSISQKRYVEIGEEEIGYANRDNWSACRKVEEQPKRYREPTPADLKNGAIECEVRQDAVGAEWKPRVLIGIEDQAVYPFRVLCARHPDKKSRWPLCRIEVTE